MFHPLRAAVARSHTLTRPRRAAYLPVVGRADESLAAGVWPGVRQWASRTTEIRTPVGGVTLEPKRSQKRLRRPCSTPWSGPRPRRRSSELAEDQEQVLQEIAESTTLAHPNSAASCARIRPALYSRVHSGVPYTRSVRSS